MQTQLRNITRDICFCFCCLVDGQGGGLDFKLFGLIKLVLMVMVLSSNENIYETQLYTTTTTKK